MNTKETGHVCTWVPVVLDATKKRVSDALELEVVSRCVDAEDRTWVLTAAIKALHL